MESAVTHGELSAVRVSLSTQHTGTACHGESSPQHVRVASNPSRVRSRLNIESEPRTEPVQGRLIMAQFTPHMRFVLLALAR